MKKQSGLPTLAWVLFILLIVSAAALRLTETQTRANPSALSFNASGTRAFADLLQREGYQVSVSTSKAPRIRANETAIMFRLWTAEPG
jgi:hypothetical protein